jgi:CheY-like chemotaxis protein
MTRILIIEDEEPLREAIVDTLTFEGYEPLQARNGAEGLAMARAYLPDLIICDVLMPELDGRGVQAALREDPATAATRSFSSLRSPTPNRSSWRSTQARRVTSQNRSSRMT